MRLIHLFNRPTRKMEIICISHFKLIRTLHLKMSWKRLKIILKKQKTTIVPVYIIFGCTIIDKIMLINIIAKCIII